MGSFYVRVIPHCSTLLLVYLLLSVEFEFTPRPYSRRGIVDSIYGIILNLVFYLAAAMISDDGWVRE